MDSSPRALRAMLTEGSVIVFSILLAFSLDAWWDTARERREIGETLIALESEFSEVEVELARSLDRNESVVTASDQVLQLMREGRGEVGAAVLGEVLRVPTTAAPEGALAALISSGRLSQISSQALRALLAGWSSVLNDVREEESSAERFVYEELIPHLTEFTEIGPALYARLDVPSEGTITLPLTIRTRNLIEMRRFHSLNVIRERDRVGVEEHLAEILQLLRAEIR